MLTESREQLATEEFQEDFEQKDGILEELMDPYIESWNRERSSC